MSMPTLNKGVVDKITKIILTDTGELVVIAEIFTDTVGKVETSLDWGNLISKEWFGGLSLIDRYEVVHSMVNFLEKLFGMVFSLYVVSRVSTFERLREKVYEK